MDDPQPSPKVIRVTMDPVHRLNGSGRSRIVVLKNRWKEAACRVTTGVEDVSARTWAFDPRQSQTGVTLKVVHSEFDEEVFWVEAGCLMAEV